MKSYDILKKFDALNDRQRREVVSYFLAGIGMDTDGFTDASSRPNHQVATYLQEQFDRAVAYIATREDLCGSETVLAPWELEPTGNFIHVDAVSRIVSAVIQSMRK